MVQALAGQKSAQAMRELHPNRLRFALFSDRNPAMQPVKALAEQIRGERKPMAKDNPLRGFEKAASDLINTYWENYRVVRDAMTEAAFLGTYGSAALQAMVGLGTPAATAERRISRDRAREAAAARQQAELERHFEVGGLPEAIVCAVIHVRLPEGRVDERGFAALQALRRAQPANRRLTFGEVKALFRDQYLLLRLDEERAVRAIPKLLPDNEQQRQTAWAAVRDVVAARGELTDEAKRRLDRLQELFGISPQQAAAE
jgi:hypothetical protein